MILMILMMILMMKISHNQKIGENADQHKHCSDVLII